MMQRFVRWHHSAFGHFVVGLIELALMYGFAALAIDRGSLWWYGLGFLCLYGALRNFVGSVKDLLYGSSYGNKRRKA